MKIIALFAFGLSTLLSMRTEVQASIFHYVPTSEENCSPVDFRKTFPLESRDQKSIAWCFAHSTADALQYVEKTPIQISAADIAINYSKSDWSQFLHFFKRLLSRNERDRPADTGLAKFAAQMIIPQGYCPEAVLPSSDWTRVNVDGTKAQDEIADAALNMFKLQAQVKDGEIPTPADLPYFYEFKHIDQVTFYTLLLTTKKLNLLENLRVAACNGERISFTHPPQLIMNLRGEHAFENINATLDRKMPLTVDFFSTILLNIDAPLDITKHFHTILLYGREFDRAIGECRYLLKDSHGESCTKYDPRLKCDHGYLSIPESTLFRTMTSDVLYQ
jgi:hypothetical protein